MKKILASLIALTALIPAASLAKPTAQQKLAIIQIQQYKNVDGKNVLQSTGSGTLIDSEGRVLTNYSVIKNTVENPSSSFLVLCLKLTDKQAFACYNALTTTLKYDYTYNVALFKIDRLRSNDTEPFLPLADWLKNKQATLPYLNYDRQVSAQKIKLASSIDALGYAATSSKSLTTATGTATGFRYTATPKNPTLTFQILTGAKITKAMSGGAVFDANANYIGITTAGTKANTGYIIPLPLINHVLRDLHQCNQGYAWSTEKDICVPIVIPVATKYPVDPKLCTNGYLGFDTSACLRLNAYCNSTASSTFWSSLSASCESSATQVTPPKPTDITPVDTSTKTPPLVGAYNATKKDLNLVARMRGQILLQVESRGEAWYLNPSDSLRYYLADGSAAYTMMRAAGSGIANIDLDKIPTATSTQALLKAKSICATNSLANRLKGKILLQVQSRGEAWYIDPRNCQRIYLKDGEAAYQVMRNLGAGITNANLEKLPSK